MIEKFEIKLNILKKKMNKQILGILMFMLFAAMSILAMEMGNNFKRQKQKIQDSYNKSLYEMVGYINNVENDLAKLQITNTTRLTSTTLADIWKQANLAKANLDSLPVEQNSMANASKYLSQVSDYSYVLMKQTISGEKINDDEYTEIGNMYEGAKELNRVMTTIYDDLNTGRIKWDEVQKEGNKKLPDAEINNVASSIDKIGKTFQEYEGLIYDGAYSDHLLSETPKNLGETEVSQEKAQQKIIEIFGEDNIADLTFKQESNGRIGLYDFNLKLKNSQATLDISITKKEGKLYLMLGDRNVLEDKISMEDAKAKGLEFLKKMGIENVKDTYYLKVENMAIINYAGVQDNVVLYPDLVKVKVALDDGEILSVETQGYIFNHTKRTDITPSITLEQAKKSLNKRVQVISNDLAIIPTESKQEVLTYEFKGKIDEREFLIYINAKTGEEERVLLIVNTPGGTLTM